MSEAKVLRLPLRWIDCGRWHELKAGGFFCGTIYKVGAVWRLLPGGVLVTKSSSDHPSLEAAKSELETAVTAVGAAP